MQKSIVSFVISGILLIVSLNASAQNNVVVIPMAGDIVNPSLAKTITNLRLADNIVTVAKQSGDFTDPVAAIASITATGANPYLLFIAPGVYTLSEPLVMKEYVDIIGSGRNATKLVGAISTDDADSSSALVLGANHASLQSLSIENTGGGTHSLGVFNFSSSSPSMSDLSITISGGDFNYGVYNFSNFTASSPSISDLSITATGGTYNIGINNVASSPRISGVNITTSGGAYTYGVYNASVSELNMSGTSITASGGSDFNYGVYNGSTTSSARVHNSVISASTNSVFAGTGSGADETYISNSTLNSSVNGDPKCFSTILDDGTTLDGACTP